MNHDYAIETHAAERYLLHELTEEERDAYEEHFFSCSICADEVKSASDFLDGARQVVQDELKKHIYRDANHYSIWAWFDWRTMRRPMPAMACVLLAVVSVFSIYQNRVTIPELRQMGSATPPVQAVTVAQLQHSRALLVREARGEDSDRLSVSRGESFLLQFDVPPKVLGSYQFFQIEVETPAGVKKLSLKISRKEASNPVQVPVPFGTLERGKYVVVIQGVNSNGTESGVKGDSACLPFEFNVQD